MSAHTESLPEAHAHATGHADAHDHDKNAPKVYLGVLVTLLILTFVTVGASYINFGAFNVIVAILIATIKASLVALFFMHLLHDKPINAIILVSAFAFFGLFLIACFHDTNSRHDVEPANLKAAPLPAPQVQSNPNLVNPPQGGQQQPHGGGH
jgi:cytochrome c oxidase subunit IV